MTGLYELLLGFPDGREELRLTDHLDTFRCGRSTLLIRERRWRITKETAPSLPAAAARLICVPVSARPSDAEG